MGEGRGGGEKKGPAKRNMDKTIQSDLTRGLADFVIGLGYDDLSDADVAHLRGLVLDHLGVALCGAKLPWGRSLGEWAATYGGTGPSVVLGTNLKVTPPVAGMVNASAAHGMELDDTVSD